MKTKTVRYYYPTSPGAEKLGCGKTGCWTIDATVYAKPVVIEGSGEDQKLVAFEWAEITPGHYEPFSIFGPNDYGNRDFVFETRARMDNGESWM